MEAAIMSKADMARQTKVGMHHCVSLATRCRTIREGCPLRWHGPGSEARGGCGQGRGWSSILWLRRVQGDSDKEPGKLEAPAPTGHKNQTWHPELRIETRDPDRIWIVCFIHDTGFDHNGGVSKTPNITSFWVQRFGVPAMSTACLGTIVEPWRHCCPPVARQTKTVHLQYQPSGCILQVTWLLLFFATDHCVVFRYVLRLDTVKPVSHNLL